MKKILLPLAAGGLIFAAGFNNSVAQKESDDNGTVPVEFYACKYNDGMGVADLDASVAKWNAWADGQGWVDYSAWTLTPFHSGPEQDFDFIWMGITPTAQVLGAAQDDWLANGGEIAAEFEKLGSCDSHSMHYTVQFKKPPERKDPSRAVLTVIGCNIKDGLSFVEDIAPSFSGWADVRNEGESPAGHWAFFPYLSGGDEEFDFHFVISHGNNEERGIDWDNHAEQHLAGIGGGDHKSLEMLDRVLDCESTSRVYIATNRRIGDSDHSL